MTVGPDFHEEPSGPSAPPSDLDAERALLGAFMLKPGVLDEVSIRLDDFYAPRHGLIFQAISDLAARGNPADSRTLCSVLAEADTLAKAGGPLYVSDLEAHGALPAHAEYYAERIRRKSHQRRVIEAGVRIQQLGHQSHLDVAESASLAQKLTGDLDPETQASSSSWLERLEDAVADIEATAAAGTGLRGIPTGISDLDRLLHGFQPGQLVVVGARPSMGKSNLGIQFARHAAMRHRRPTGFFSLEMGALEVVKRVISAELQINLDHLISGQLSDADWVKIARALSKDGVPLSIEDNSALSLAEIRSIARSWQRRDGLDLVVIDYLQLIRTRGRSESRQQEVTAISQGLKQLARELNVPVVVCAQLNRGSEQRGDKRPFLSDLRESGSIEADADVVMLLHREDYYEKESARAGEADIIVAKNRNGCTDTVTVASQLHYARFVDMAHGI